MITKTNFKLINGTNRFFIDESGFCFKVSKWSKKEEEIPININRGVPRVMIESKKLNLVLLMIEYFGNETKDFTYTYKIKNNKLPLDCIKIKNLDHCSKDEKLIHLYKCDKKASSQNSRVKQKQRIDSNDILNSLKRTGFKCFYCGDFIKPKTWHIDHVQPLSKGGLNVSLNITPSCKPCNLMKGALPLSQFLDRVNKIYKNQTF